MGVLKSVRDFPEVEGKGTFLHLPQRPNNNWKLVLTGVGRSPPDHRDDGKLCRTC